MQENLWIPKWSEAFRATISGLTGETNFSYRVAGTHLKGTQAHGNGSNDRDEPSGCSIGFLPLQEMGAEMLKELTTTPAASQIGRLAQLLKAAGLTAPQVVAQPAEPKRGSDAALVEQLENEE